MSDTNVAAPRESTSALSKEEKQIAREAWKAEKTEKHKLKAERLEVAAENLQKKKERLEHLQKKVEHLENPLADKIAKYKAKIEDITAKLAKRAESPEDDKPDKADDEAFQKRTTELQARLELFKEKLAELENKSPDEVKVARSEKLKARIVTLTGNISKLETA